MSAIQFYEKALNFFHLALDFYQLKFARNKKEEITVKEELYFENVVREIVLLLDGEAQCYEMI